MAAKTATNKKTSTSSRLTSRAVTRDVEAGSTVDCAQCGDRVKFQAKVRNRQVICNVYIKGAWDRVEHYHSECYTDAEEPYGEPEPAPDFRRRRAAAAAAKAETKKTA